MADVLADVRAMIALLRADQKYGPYVLRMSLEQLRTVNPALAATIEAAGPDVAFELLVDNDGQPYDWRRL